jgi:hypothetical protein
VVTLATSHAHNAVLNAPTFIQFVQPRALLEDK